LRDQSEHGLGATGGLHRPGSRSDACSTELQIPGAVSPRSSPDTTGLYAYAGHPFSPNRGRERSLAVPISFNLWPAPGFGGLR